MLKPSLEQFKYLKALTDGPGASPLPPPLPLGPGRSELPPDDLELGPGFSSFDRLRLRGLIRNRTVATNIHIMAIMKNDMPWSAGADPASGPGNSWRHSVSVQKFWDSRS